MSRPCNIKTTHQLAGHDPNMNRRDVVIQVARASVCEDTNRARKAGIASALHEQVFVSAVADHSGGIMRTALKTFLFAPAFVLAAACSQDKPADPSLNADLSLAAQANTARMDSISAAERTAAAAVAPAPVAVRSAPARTSTSTARRTTSTRRSSSGGSSTGGSTSGSTAQPAQRTETVKNTKRDAIIGGVAGAAIGAATSRNKVKGAVIGGAAGAILGGVIGNNVDVQKKPVP